MDLDVDDVMACHPIPTPNIDNKSYLVRICNRSPGSAWQTLAAGMVTGKNFTDHQIYVNFQLTKGKSALAKEVRKARKERKIQKYSVDSNGRLTVKFDGNKRWFIIKSTKDLEETINGNQ